MKKKILIALTLIFVLIIVWFNRGTIFKHNYKKTNKTKPIKKIETQKDFTPYSWISKEPLKNVEGMEDKKGSWKYAENYYKKRLMQGGEWNEKKLAKRFILSIDIYYCNSRNIQKHFFVNASRPYNKKPDEKIESFGNFLFFDSYDRIPEESKFYEDKNKIKKKIKIAVRIKESHCFFYFKLLKKICPSTYKHLSKLYKEGKIKENEILQDYFKGNILSNSNPISLVESQIPSKIDGTLFTTWTPRKEYYKSPDLEITAVDIYGNIAGRYGYEEFIISPGEEWSSKFVKNVLPRKWFEYDWPEYKNGKWEYDDKYTISFCALKKRKDNPKKMEGTYWIDFKTDDKYLIELAKKKRYYSREEFKKIFKYIKKDHPDLKLNFKIDEWEKFHFWNSKQKGDLEIYLPKKGDPTFYVNIKVINHGWRIFYQ